MMNKIQNKWRLILGFLIIMSGFALSDWMYIGVPLVIVGLGFSLWQAYVEKKGIRRI
jgi:hypothetical protein